MAGEIGGPPGMPEFKAPKDDDEEAKPRFSFLRPKEEESPPDVPPPAELFAANTESDDDEEEGSLMDRFMKTFGGKVKNTVEVETPTSTEITEEQAEEPDPVEAAAAPIDATAEDIAPLPEMPPIEAATEVTPTEVEPTEEVPFEVAEDFADGEAPVPEEEPLETETEEQPAEYAHEITDNAVETEPEESEAEEDEPDASTTHTSSRRGANPLASALPGIAAASSATAAAAEAADPNKQSGKAANSALPLVGLGLAAYANHKANKARREVREEQKSREQQMKEIAQEQAKQQQELQAKLNQLNVAPMPTAAPTIEREEVSAPATNEAPDKSIAKVDQQAEVTAPQSLEATPVLPPFEQELPKSPTQEQEAAVAPGENRLPVSEKTPTTERIPSIGDILAEKAPALQQVEKQAELQKEKALETEEEVILDAETRPNPQELVESAPYNRAAELYYQQVEAAAEQGVAIENQYEKQHEVKDVSSIGAGATVVGATSIVSKDDLFQKDAPDDMGQFVRVNYDGSSTTYQTRPTPKLKPEYKQAMVRGAAGAGAVIIGTIIWTIL